MINAEILATDMSQVRQALKGFDKELKKHIKKDIRSKIKPMQDEIRKSALRTLPARGMLNKYVGETIRVTDNVSVSGRGVTVKLTGAVAKSRAKKYSKSKGKRKYRQYGHQVSLTDLDRGRIGHPVYGRGKLVYQNIKPGFWKNAIRGEVGDKVVATIKESVQQAAVQVARDITSARESR